MKSIRVSELSGLALDWAVATCEGLAVYIPAYANTPWLQIRTVVGTPVLCPMYSTDWSQGGAIIDRNRICVHAYLDPAEGWNACVYPARVRKYHLDGPTPLIAAMRCYVASKMGEVIEIPDELA